MIGKFKTILLLGYICIASISAAIITPALPSIQSFFSLTKGDVEWVVSIFLLGYVFGQLIYAPIANSYGRIKALQTGLWINLIGIVMCVISTRINDYSLLLIGRFITALGAASGLTCTFMLINELLEPKQAKQAMSLAIVAFTIGIGIAVLLGSLITQYLQWQDCFLLLFIHGIAMLILTKQFPETLKVPAAIHPKTIAMHYLTAFKNTRLIIFSVVVGFVSVFSYGYSAAAPIYAQIDLKLSASQYGYWNCVNMIGMGTGGICCVYLIKKMGEKYVLILGLTCIFPGLIALMVLSLLKTHNPLFFFLVTSYLYLVTGLLFPSASYFASNAITDRASASSVMSFINMGSAMIAVIILGYLPFNSAVSLSLVLSSYYVVIVGLVVLSIRGN
ncbi:MAG: MFS transporter [Gammaproteobacteria bacterium]|nr:MFS transporter [Gammaproteobacteria bacterium]